MYNWPEDNVHYFGTANILHSDGSVTIHYNDVDVEQLNMDNVKCV